VSAAVDTCATTASDWPRVGLRPCAVFAAAQVRSALFIFYAARAPELGGRALVVSSDGRA
jgi:hypothetical protein